MMKKVVLACVVLSMMALSANAGLTIVILDESGEWVDYEDSEFTVTPSTDVVYGALDDGGTTPGAYALGLLSGPGSLSETIDIVAGGVTAVMMDDAVRATDLGIQNPFITMSLDSSVDGLLWTSTFHCDGEGDVKLVAINEDTYLVEDVQVVHQVPEPATLAFLGLGGLLLKRRRN
jgi:hypothetical protein